MAKRKSQHTVDVVRIESVSKRFVIRKDDSLKERIVTFGRRGRKHREEFWALKDVSVVIPAGTTVGLIGHNGSGKSTLLKMIGGIISPTAGRIETRGRLAALLELGAGFHPDLTGRENVFLNASLLGLSRAETERKFDEIVAFSGLHDFIDTQVKFYSSGMFVRLAFSVAIHAEPDILLVDEVLAVGDELFQRQCLDKIREFQSQGRTIILVTHSMAHVLDFCDRTVVLDHGSVRFDGLPAAGVEFYRDLLEQDRLKFFAEIQGDEGGQHYITDVYIGSPREGSTAEFTPGSDLKVGVEFEVPQAMPQWMVRVIVTNPQGVVAVSTHSQAAGITESLTTGTHVVEIAFPSLQLGAGTYTVAVTLEAKDRVLQALPRAGAISVAQTPHVGGLIYAKPVGTLRPKKK